MFFYVKNHPALSPEWSRAKSLPIYFWKQSERYLNILLFVQDKIYQEFRKNVRHDSVLPWVYAHRVHLLFLHKNTIYSQLNLVVFPLLTNVFPWDTIGTNSRGGNRKWWTQRLLWILLLSAAVRLPRLPLMPELSVLCWTLPPFWWCPFAYWMYDC